MNKLANGGSGTLRRAAAMVAAVVVLAGTLGFLFERSRQGDAEGSAGMLTLLRQLKQVDAQWNADVLRSKAGLDATETPAAKPQPLVASLHARVSGSDGERWGDDAARARIAPLLADLKATLDAKTALVERFMAQNATLRNASRHLPQAGNELIEAARTKIADKRTAADLQEAAQALVADVMTYMLLADAPLRARIEHSEAALVALVPHLPADVAAVIEGMRPHVQTVLRQQKAGDEVLAQVAALPAAKKLDVLTDACGEENARLLAGQHVWTQALVAYGALLLVLFAWQGWRLARSAGRLEESTTALRRATRELQESQATLMQAEKMSALGQMVAGIAHEINTPLAYLKGTVSLLREHVVRVGELAKRSLVFTEMLAAKEKDTAALARAYGDVHTLATEAVEKGMLNELRQLLDDGGAGIDQIAEIVVNLKNFSRLDRARVTAFDVREGLDSTLLLARNMLKNVRVIREFGDVPKITCSPSSINQVFLNLVTNAVQSIPAGREGFITLRTEMDDPKTVRIEIQDNGAGIPADALPKIFDPFFTTKEIGQGTGMGLSISYKIVKQHGGAILVDTEADVGTVFTLLLPVEPPPAPATVHEDFVVEEA